MRRDDGHRSRRRPEVREGEHRGQPGDGTRLLDVDGPDQGMGVRRPQDDGMQHPGQRDVADVAAPALEEARIFLATESVADELHGERGNVVGRPAISIPV